MFKRFWNWLKSVFANQPSVEKQEEVLQKSKVPTREQMLEVFLGLCNGTIPNRLGIPYREIRETHGNNRSPHIDRLIKNQGGILADPYCMWGMQEVIDQLCIYYNVDRKLVSTMIPKGGSTQTVFAKSSEAIKKNYPIQMSMVFWRQNSNPSRGHVGMVVSPLKHDSSFETFEFNTDIRADEVVRDGQGAGFVNRRINGTSLMKIIGYVDLYLAITNVIESQTEG